MVFYYSFSDFFYTVLTLNSIEFNLELAMKIEITCHFFLFHCIYWHCNTQLLP